MKDRLIKNLEALLEEKDPEKIKEIMAAITVNSDFVKSENIMQPVSPMPYLGYSRISSTGGQ